MSITSTVTGNLGSDAEVRYSSDGRAIITFRVASSRRKKNQEGEWEDVTDWVRVTTMPRDTALEYMQNKATKGAKVTLIGRLEPSAYMNRDSLPTASLDMPFPYEIIWQGAGQSRSSEPEDENQEETAAARTRSNGATKPAANRKAAAPVDDGSDLADLPF